MSLRFGTRLGPPRLALRRFRAALGVALVGLFAFLLVAPSPWLLPGEPTLIPRPGQSRIHTVLVALWWAAAANLVLCVLLLGTARAWATDLSAPGARRAKPGCRTWILLLLASALAGVLRWPLATGSLWWDEAWSVRHTLVGRLEPGVDASSVEFRPVPWLDTLWNYRAPTNHVAYSIAARVSLAGWRAATGAERQAFDELALRFPAWFAAMGSVVAIGLLVHGLGLPAAAAPAAFLLAIHPWHIRYGSDGRGYSFVVFLTIAAASFLLRALREDRWRFWLGYAGAQTLLLWTLPIAVYVPLALGISAALTIALGPREGRGRLVRLAVANTFAAMAYLQVMAPNLAQAFLLERLLGEQARLDLRFAQQLFVAATTGLHVRMPLLPDVWFPTLASLLETRPWLPGLVYGVLPAIMAVGAFRSARRGNAERAVTLALVAAPLLLILHRTVDGFFAYPRFAIYSVVPAVALLAIGCEGILRVLARTKEAAVWVLPLGFGGALAGYELALAPLTRILLTHPHAPAREVAEFISAREVDEPAGVAAIGIGLGGDVPRVYDPRIEALETAESLRDACEHASAAGRAVYVFYGHEALNRRRIPDTFTLLDDRRVFEPMARFVGIESEHVYRVLRHTGAPLETPASRNGLAPVRRCTSPTDSDPSADGLRVAQWLVHHLELEAIRISEEDGVVARRVPEDSKATTPTSSSPRVGTTQ